MIDLNKQAALVVAHPGHELRVFGWLERTRPTVCVITDGSGRSGNSRVDSSSELLRKAGASKGPIFGHLTDLDAYEHILQRSYGPFLSIADELAEFLITRPIAYVVADAFEGYNPMHDICRLIVDSAVERTRNYRPIQSYAFTLTGRPDPGSHVCPSETIELRLDHDTFSRKLASAKSYAGLESEVTTALTSRGEDVFRKEYLWIESTEALASRFHGEPPLYEQFGEDRVSQGYYNEVIRFRDHILPLAKQLKNCSKVVEELC
jgi:hypothetical protein